jgi:hypothetical protein
MKIGTVIAIIVTIIWLILAVIWGIANDLLANELNEQGDYIAGIVAPIAFLWFILGYYQQGHEIKKNTQALKDQQQELNEQRKAMQNQAVSLAETSKTLQEYNRPFMTAHFELKGSRELIIFVVQNVGIRPAYSVEFKFDPSLKEFAFYDKMDYEKFINLDFIPPNYRREFIISNRIKEISGEKDVDWKVNVTIEYEDKNSNKFNDKYVMSFFDSHWKIYEELPSIEESLKKLNENAKSVLSRLKSI